MANPVTWTQDQLERYTKRQKRLNGEPEYEDEDAMQAACEQFLRQCGFRSRTPANCATHHKKLWYVHLSKKVCRTHEAPILCDLVLSDTTGGAFGSRRIEIELKNGNTDMTDEQKYLYKRGEIVLCRSYAEFTETVYKWINGDKK